jgi:hypothetical protein
MPIHQQGWDNEMLITGIFLQAGGIQRPSAQQWMSGYSLLDAELSRFGVVPEYEVLDSLSGLGKFKKRSTAQPRRLAPSECDGIDTLALAATPPGVSKPGWNWSSLGNLSYLDSYGRLSLSLMLDNEHCQLGSQAFEKSVSFLSSFANWDFGWAMARDKERGIELYLGGIGGGDGFTPEDRRLTSMWYEVYQPEERRKRVRDIFPYNMVGPEHLARRLPDGRDLRAFIETDADSELSSLTDNLWLWKVKSDRTEAVREKLRGAGIIIAE